MPDTIHEAATAFEPSTTPRRHRNRRPRRVVLTAALALAALATSLGMASTSATPADAYSGQSYTVTGAGGQYAKVWGPVTWLQRDQVKLYHGIRDLTTDGRNAEAWAVFAYSDGTYSGWFRFDVSGSTSNVYRTYTSPRMGKTIDGVMVMACRSTGANCGYTSGWIWR
ncbi:MAG: hypothetical protein MUF83_13045 [Acidimicrobiales bacterium]|jgi:hypothetical protein|nr:hypothetical protein [Acidimicrobiales bacterium]